MPETVVHFQIRMPPALHERLVTVARDTKVSLNQLVVEMLKEAAAQNEHLMATASHSR
jgi:predicted HicB family RNase H-like nuclease